MVTDRKIGITE